MTQPYAINPIGIIHSPYQEKFAIPRQPGLVTAAQARIELLPPYNHEDCLRGLSDFSHLWLIFAFHETASKGWKPLVRPPRLGGNKKMGVFASRSTFRPNPIGMSAVKLLRITKENDKLFIEIEGADLLNQTPVLDIKPYLPYADSIEDARGAYAEQEPEQLGVIFTEQAKKHLENLPAYKNLQPLIEQVLAQDPRPAYQKKPNKDNEEPRTYGMSLYDLNIQWQVNTNNQCEVFNICKK